MVSSPTRISLAPLDLEIVYSQKRYDCEMLYVNARGHGLTLP